MPTTRRQIIRSAGAVGAATVLPAAARGQTADFVAPDASPEEIAADRDFWARVHARYTVTDDIINLENGYWGIMADPVKEAFIANQHRVNEDNTLYARGGGYGEDRDASYQSIAELLQVDPEEIALTRGASESCQNLITGYNKLEPGDQVLYADLDYGAMISNMEFLADRRGVEVVQIDLPEPATHDAMLEAYTQAFERLPRLRLVLLTHVTHRFGVIPPVREIAALARDRGADVILDAAHSWGQVDFKPADLGIDFIGFNLHKWIGNPQGAGFLYIKAERTADIDPYMGEPDDGTARSRVHTGTPNMACWITVPTAIDFHKAIGPANKEARLRYLRDLWVKEVRDVPGVDVLTVDDPRTHAGITGFRLNGQITTDENKAIVERLKDEFGILTVHRTGAAAGVCIRVTPAIYTREEDVLALADALKVMAKG
ncbi:MAG: aminotransferase class V-fold PLP-dependent enzyme [Geminicoccaceae bacterium]